MDTVHGLKDMYILYGSTSLLSWHRSWKTSSTNSPTCARCVCECYIPYAGCVCKCCIPHVCVCLSLCVRVRVSILRHTRTQAHTQCETCANLPTNLLRQPPPPISSMLRQAVVFCLVDLYRALGEDLIPHLDAGLSNSQLKLVTIYINRLQA